MFKRLSRGGNRPASFSVIPVTLILILCLSPVLHAESIFMKDGSIVEGAIKSENDTSYRIETPDKKVTTIKRSKVLRIVNDASYKVKKYIKKKDGKLIEGYIVEESTDEYTIREKLDSPAEFSLDKAEVVSMSTEKFISKTTYYLLGVVPGVAQVYADKNTAGLAFMGGFVASCGLTGWSWYNYKTKKQAYDDLTLGTSRSTFDARYDEYRTASYIFLGSAILTGLVYMANWADVIWFHAPDFGGGEQSAQAGDVFYNITSGEPGGMNMGDDGTGPGDAGFAYDYSLVRISAGVRF